jgi:hypothetical protein
VKPVIYNGEEMPIDHLAPMSITCPCSPIGRELIIDVSFANHCYSEAFIADVHDSEQIILTEAEDRHRILPVRVGLLEPLDVIGAPPGPKSRGGLVIVVGGPSSPLCWARAPLAPTTVAPAAIARPWTSVRREIIDSGSRRTSRVITSSQCMRRPVDPATRP